MKKRLLTFVFAALTVGLLGSCSKINERIDGLDKRVYDLENNKIASVEQQITAINTSINELKAADVTINGKIDELKQASDAQQALIDALQEADQALGQKDAALEARIATLEGQVTTINGQIDALVNADIAINTRIDTLSTYVDTQIGKAKDWANETFATLTQYQQTADDLAALSVTVTGISTTLAEVQTSITGLDAKIDGIDASLQDKITTAKTELEGKIADLKTELEGKIADAISASETSIQGWVNEQLSAYYTAAQVDAEITDLQNQINTLKTDTDANKTKIEELETSLAKLKADLDAAKTTIKAAYEKAIKDAIEGHDGYITETIKNAIDEANGKITALTGRVEDLETAIGVLTGRVDAIEAMIQSVSITPAYSDGSVEAVDGILTLKCVVSPAEALTGMQSLKDSLLIYADYVKVKTKSSPAYTEITVSEATVLDDAQGAITLKADISEYLPKGADQALTVALKIKNGISNYTTEFVPVYVAGPAIPEGALKGVFSVSADKKVYFSKGNLTYDVNASTNKWKFYEHQYDRADNGSASATLISLFTWGYSASTSLVYNGSAYVTDHTTDGDKLLVYDKASSEGGDDWGVAYCESNNITVGTWRTLSKDEWTYLFDNHSKKWVTVNGVGGYVIAPDNVTLQEDKTSYTETELNDANLVFLPAAGDRSGSDVSDVGGSGSYWSSTADDEYCACRVYFSSDDVCPDDYGYRFVGYSVRLITESK